MHYESMEIRVLHPGMSSCHSQNKFVADVFEGLSKHPKRIPSVYFYDKKGSELFCEITKLEEYYPTRCETEILRKYKWALAQYFSGHPFNLIELGAGDGNKTMILLEHFLNNRLEFNYVPVDICAESVQLITRKIYSKFRGAALRVNGMVADYFDAIHRLASESGRRNVVLFLGSNIGNFRKEDACNLLFQLAQVLQSGDYVLIGFDLNKDLSVLELAYNDPAGVTREFNLNLLDRMNRELGANFDRGKFEHMGCYNERLSAMESWLTSLEDQTVEIKEAGAHFHFRKGERIHTEYSHKYSVSDIHNLAKGTGFNVQSLFFDSRRYFVDALWKVR